MDKASEKKDIQFENNLPSGEQVEQGFTSKQDTDPAEELKECRNQLMRVTADFQNFKKRTSEEQIRWTLLAKASVLTTFLPLADDVDRAIENASKSIVENVSDDSKSDWLEGFRLIQKNLQKIFSDNGVTEIDCSGNFDPELHEAMMQIESKDHKKEEIVEVFLKGYKFDSQVLRHAKVSVAK